MLSKKINEYITLKLENNETEIYIGEKKFIQCKYLIMDIPMSDVSDYDHIESIDEIVDYIVQGVPPIVTPEEIFWGHCSNIQTWVEMEYDTRVLHSKLSFPLLKRLTEVGDEKAKNLFNLEILKRMKSNYEATIVYLVEEKFTRFLTPRDLSYLLRDINDINMILFMFRNGVFNDLHPDEAREFIREYSKDKFPGVAREEEEAMTFFYIFFGIVSGITSKEEEDPDLRKLEQIITQVHGSTYVDRDKHIIILNVINMNFSTEISNVMFKLMKYYLGKLKFLKIFSIHLTGFYLQIFDGKIVTKFGKPFTEDLYDSLSPILEPIGGIMTNVGHVCLNRCDNIYDIEKIRNKDYFICNSCSYSDLKANKRYASFIMKHLDVDEHMAKNFGLTWAKKIPLWMGGWLRKKEPNLVMISS